ncbi:MAG: hypothetical protein MK212_19205, partial [Saprospiraceae bacterium]|nr:hypothetical protein [Saprospiraceae bacterium]
MKSFFLFISFFIYSSLQAQVTELWGLTRVGGSDNFGVIYKTNGDGSAAQLQHNFENLYPGQSPYGTPVLASNGKLYGMTSAGGANNIGILFEYDPALNEYKVKLDFDGTNLGSYPQGSLYKASNNKLYGMTSTGGSSNGGTLFEYDPIMDTIVVKVHFDGTSLGRTPFGSLMQANNGKIYGLTRNGGDNNLGVLFEYNITLDTCIKKIDFDGSNTGSYPYGKLIQSVNGLLYGTASAGGANGNGVLFEYNIWTEAFVKELDFDGTTNGASPYSHLSQASNNKLYGTTMYGGIHNQGTLFEYDPILNIFVKKVDFESNTLGQTPRSGLNEANNGMLYGMTSAGGANGKGTIYEYDINTSNIQKRLDFDGTSMGAAPYANLIAGPGNSLYGLTSAGGGNNYGLFFEYNFSSNTLTKKFSFESAGEGSTPNGSLIYANNNLLYGMTYFGGIDNLGVLFAFDPFTNTYEKKFDFDDINGASPSGNLLQASDGKLYGLTSEGGVNDLGVIFEYDIALDTYNKRYDFTGTTDGESPRGTLIEAGNGKLYGLTSSGGLNDKGTLFEYDPVAGIFTKKIDFDGSNLGASPQGSLLLASNGKLYGLTASGGASNFGTLFEYDILSNTITKRVDFNGSNRGSYPYGSLIEAGTTGKLYGLAYFGGSSNRGALFEYDINTNTYAKKFDFNATSGSYPRGSLMQAMNGNLYGTTYFGGANNQGTIFEYDYINESFSKTSDLDGSVSGSYTYGDLVEIITCHNSRDTLFIDACNSYTVPSGDETYTTAGSYVVMDTVSNHCGADSILRINLTINTLSLGVDVISACNSYTWIDGLTYTSNNNTATHTLTNAAGCDSIITLDLTIANTVTGSDVVAACNSYTWIDGITYTSDN